MGEKSKQADQTNIGDSVTESEYYYLGRKIHTQQTFKRMTLRPFDALNVPQYQFAVSNGYAYDFHGLSVSTQIEYGWVKIKTE